MMCNRDVLDWLARNRLFDLLDRLQRDAIASGSLHHEDVIVEVDKQDVIAAGASRVDLVCVFRHRRGRRKSDRAKALGHFELLGCELDIECDLCESEVVGYFAVQHTHATSRKDVLADFSLPGKARLENRVTGKRIR